MKTEKRQGLRRKKGRTKCGEKRRGNKGLSPKDLIRLKRNINKIEEKKKRRIRNMYGVEVLDIGGVI